MNRVLQAGGGGSPSAKMKLVATFLGVAVNPVVFIVGNQQITIPVVVDSLRRQGLPDFRTGFF